MTPKVYVITGYVYSGTHGWKVAAYREEAEAVALLRSLMAVKMWWGTLKDGKRQPEAAADFKALDPKAPEPYYDFVFYEIETVELR